MDMREQITRIERMQEETRRFVAEMHEARAAGVLNGWQIAVTGMAAGAALFGAAAAFLKLLA